MPKFYLNLGYKLKKKALCYSHLNNTVDIFCLLYTSDAADEL